MGLRFCNPGFRRLLLEVVLLSWDARNRGHNRYLKKRTAAGNSSVRGSVLDERDRSSPSLNQETLCTASSEKHTTQCQHVGMIVRLQIYSFNHRV